MKDLHTKFICSETKQICSARSSLMKIN